MGERPRNFRINYGHQLAQGLVFAGLGRHENSAHYRDSSLYGNHGTLTNMAIPATATSGWTWGNELGRWALAFDGSNDTVSTPAVSLPIAGPFTVAVWFKASAVATSFTISQYQSADANRWALEIASNKINHWQGGNPRVSSTGTYVANQWTHAAETYTAGAIQLYLNGVADGSGSYGSAIASQPLKLSDTVLMTGSLADAMGWNRILSPTEISILSNRSDPMLSGLILPPRRRLWASAAAPPAGFKAYWANRRHRIIGSGMGV